MTKRTFEVTNPETNEKIRVTVEEIAESEATWPSRTTLSDAFVDDLIELNMSGWAVEEI